ncbi:unnamed protein product [Arctogadus glacialis]
MMGASGPKIGQPCPTTLVHLVWLFFIAGTIVSANCPPNEYRHGIECCPECPSGKRVSEDCRADKITACELCSEGTFHNGYNKRKECDPCTDCPPGLGLKVKKLCTKTSDTLCELLDGYFCKETKRGGCMAAQRHKDCSPGQYIRQRGTASEDTVCIKCIDGTFSDGNSTSCLPHTRCGEGQQQIKPGTQSTDFECGEPSKALLWLSSILIVLIPVFILMLCVCYRKKKKDGKVETYFERGPQQR